MVPLMPNIPCILNPVCTGQKGGGAIQVLSHPLEEINRLLQDLANGAMNLFVHTILQFPGGYGNQGKLLDVFDGNVLGLAQVLVALVVVGLVAAALIKQNKVSSLFHAILILVIVGGLGAGIFVALHWVNKVGQQAAEVVWKTGNGPQVATGHLLAIPVVSNTLGSIVELSVILGSGVIVVALVALYSLMIPFLIALAPLGLALKSMGDRGEKFFNSILAWLIVTMLIGRLLVVAVVRIAVTINNHMDSSFISSITLFIAFVAAIVLQFMAFRWSSKTIAPKMTGALKGASDSLSKGIGSFAVPVAAGAGAVEILHRQQASSSGKAGALGHVHTEYSRHKEVALHAAANKLAASARNRAAAKVAAGTAAKAGASATGVGLGLTAGAAVLHHVANKEKVKRSDRGTKH